jgi:glycosyltransferase involved in cell wall biosynthesis
MEWDLLPLASDRVTAGGARGTLQKGVAGAAWVARLAVAARRHDITHVHSAGILRHARFGVRRFVLHCHGTDVRTQQYQDRWRRPIVHGLEVAEAVFYSTPDLAEHVLPARPDAVYLPVPIDVARVPRWQPARLPTVVFASRWGPDKGGEAQLTLAGRVRQALTPDVDVVGLDWGPLAGRAAEHGIRLVPPMPRVDYLALLASATVVVGQSAGIVAASELEALAVGAPLVLPTALDLYAADPPPVLGGDPDAAVDAVVATVSDPSAWSADAARGYVERVHGVEHGLDTVLETYDAVLRRR